MKHKLNITILLLATFLLAHFVGLLIIDKYLPQKIELEQRLKNL